VVDARTARRCRDNPKDASTRKVPHAGQTAQTRQAQADPRSFPPPVNVMPRLARGGSHRPGERSSPSHVVCATLTICLQSSEHILTMFSVASRQVARCAVRQQCRAFSSTPSVGAAAEVKKLGVIGAGQMVCNGRPDHTGEPSELTFSGPWNSSRSSTESLCTSPVN
jgi:hypothetical protein